MKQILHRVNSLICTPKNSNHVRSMQIRPEKEILPKQNNPVANHLNFITTLILYSSFMKHTIVLGGSQFTRCIPLSKRVAKIKNQAGSGHFASKSWRQIWWRVNQPFITSEVNSTVRRCSFNHTDLGQNLVFFALFKPMILQFFTILLDKLHSFNIQQQIIALTPL